MFNWWLDALATKRDGMLSSTVVRAIFRSSSGKAATLLTVGARAAPTRSPLHIASKQPFSQFTLRIPIEMNFFMESMLLFHSATSSSLMTSKLCVSRHSYGWLSEVSGLQSLIYDDDWKRF
ncbi:protein NUCLEAR FUSION DEFECTIVE 6 [Cucumis melo var. makuwa]|uniref:Protein NUCLEAR FUSION DEFECTIVE 6 n=1 Tax=Cucumis melo var. makuwa TaxID=1194695 RepID=A0A5A7VFR7_CUCMM|nr:protein NUCLEAR FUSION DEFECTIVE 6 [Cucumis melo var. makuwa]